MENKRENPWGEIARRERKMLKDNSETIAKEMQLKHSVPGGKLDFLQKLANAHGLPQPTSETEVKRYRSKKSHNQRHRKR